MSSTGKLGVKGIKSSGNELTLPAGSTTVADHCVIPSRDVIRTRRGQAPFQSVYIDNDSTDANSNRAKEFYQWGSALLVNYTGSGGYKLSSFADLINTATYANVGSYAPPEPTVMRMKFAELTKSVYWTTDAGLATLDVVGGTARAAGIRAPEGIETAAGVKSGLSGNPNASGSWLPVNAAVGVRACVGFKDANGVIHLSAACGRVVISNPADLTVAIGSLVLNANVVTATVASHTYQVGDILNITLSGADIGNFTTGAITVTAVTSTTIVWADPKANYTNVATVPVTSGTKYIAYLVLLPPSLTTSHFVQVYRTDESAGATVDPGDEMFLVYERYLSSTDLTNRYIAIADKTPSSRAGAALDSNANTGEGALGINTRPPLCRDLCTWDGKLWGAHTTDAHRLFVRILGTGTPDGLQSGDVLCLHTFAFIVGTDFTAYTEYTPTLNVLRTLRSLVSGMNYVLNNASYVLRLIMDGDDNETWGKFSFEEDGVGGGALYAGASRATSFADALATTIPVDEAASARTLGTTVTVTTTSAHGFSVGQTIVLARNAIAAEADFALGAKTVATTPSATTFTYTESGNNATFSGASAYFVYAATFKSDNNKQPVRFSRPGIPEAWPLANTIGGLPDAAEVLRIHPTPDGGELLVCLKDGDIYAIGGQYPYNVRRVDGSAQLFAADTLKEHANQLHALTTQGPATIGSNGVGVVGGDIEDEWRELLADITNDALDRSSMWGMSYESDRQYHMWMPVDTAPASRAYVWHSMAGAWTRWTSLSRSCGLVFRGADLLLLGDGSGNRLLGEVKLFGTSMYQTGSDGIKTTTANGTQNNVTTIAVATTTTALGAGDLIRISGTYYRVVSATATAITIGTSVSVTNGQSIVYYRRFSPIVTFALESGAMPGVEKRFREVQLFFARRHFATMTVTFKSEHSDTETATVSVTPNDFTLNTQINRPTTLRVEVPSAMRSAGMLTVSISTDEARGFFDLLGYSATFEPISERTGK